MKNHLLSAAQIAALRKRFERYKTQILALDWVTQGSLSQSPQGNWRWTRKVKAKTTTVALSDQQAELFRRAIDDHRKLEKLVDQMRAISQQMHLNFAPFVSAVHSTDAYDPVDVRFAACGYAGFWGKLYSLEMLFFLAGFGYALPSEPSI